MLASIRGPVPHPRAPRRALRAAVAALLCVLLLPAMAARADSPSTLTVVGTSDVKDSGLIPDLVTPMFEKAYPQFTLQYVSVGTGVAITDAQTGQASALLVHAASLENQLVAQGFSKEPFGRAIFYGDYVLAGPANDPAGVLTGAPHDIAAAFARIAAAGAAGKADFISRGGTPGTTVQEHAIWALDAGTPGLNLCAVSAANGGGEAPSTATGSCPATSANPSWYHATGLTQAANIEVANTCNFANASASGGNDCYVFTDRGTFQCLTSVTCAGGAAAPGNLKIVTRDNSATAKGGATELINSFHAYAINPAKFTGDPNVQINSTAATDFLNFITSPSFQAELKSYLGGTDGPPFIADAAPAITIAHKLPSQVKGGSKVTVKGTVANLVPGTPPLKGVQVSVSEVVSGLAAGLPIASARTDATGAYSVTFLPPSTGNFQLTTPQLRQIERSDLNPVFGDLLQPAASTAAKITVQGVVRGLAAKARPGQLLVTGSVLPGSGHLRGSVVLLARKGTKGSFEKIATGQLSSGDRSFVLAATRAPGTWFVKVRFSDPGQVLSTTTTAKKVKVAARDTARVSTGSVKVKRGKVTVKGTIGPQPLKPGTTVSLLAADVGTLPAATSATAQAAAGGAVRLRTVAQVKLRAGARRFTLSARLRRGHHWVLELGYSAGGATGSAWGLPRSARVT